MRVPVWLQVLTKVPSVYKLSLPSNVRSILAQIGNLCDIGLEPLVKLPIQCVGLHGFIHELRAYMVLPVFAMLCPLLFAVARKTVNARSSPGGGRDKDIIQCSKAIFMQALPSILFITFLAFPLVSNQAFRGFACEDVGGIRCASDCSCAHVHTWQHIVRLR